MNIKTIIFYNDAQVFGGHEVMSASLANDVSSRHHVFYFCSQKEFKQHLKSSVQRIDLPFRSSTGPLAILKNVNFYDISWIRRQFQVLNPDIVCVVQGAIDLGLRGLVAARLQKYLTVSYIPMAFPRHVMGLSNGFIFDRYSTLIFRLFNAIITINSSQQSFMGSFFKARCPLFILENCIDTERLNQKKRNNRPVDRLQLGFVGRLEWQQKGLDQLLDIAVSLKKSGGEFDWLVFGDGPDRHRFEQELLQKDLHGFFEMRGWVEDQETIYQDIDILVMTSCFEGVPMVMLEALTSLVPVLARLAPGTQVFAEYLPEFCLYSEIEEAVDILRDYEGFVAQFSQHAEKLRENIVARHNRDAFTSQALAIVDQLSCNRTPIHSKKLPGSS